MMKVVPVEEQRRSDYLLLMTTLKIRFAALKLACDGTVDVAKVFASIDLVGDMEGQASEASLRGITVQNAMSLLARLLKERKLPWPIADFDKCQALRQLSLRVALVGEAATALRLVPCAGSWALAFDRLWGRGRMRRASSIIVHCPWFTQAPCWRRLLVMLVTNGLGNVLVRGLR